MASPDPKRQQQSQQQQQQIPPEYKPFEEEPGEKRRNFEDLTEQERAKIQAWLNNFKTRFNQYFAAHQFKLSPEANELKTKVDQYLSYNQFGGASSSNLFTRRLLSMLAMYQGELVGFYLSEGAMEMLFSVLGPIGNAWRSVYGKNIDWKMAWMKNPLNPNAVYYYLNSLPNQEAFKIAMLPVKGVIAIMAKGGGPFTLATYRELDPRHKDYGQVKQKHFFTPFLKATQAAHVASDAFYKLSGEVDTETKHGNFAEALNYFKSAKENGDKNSIAAAHQRIRYLLDEEDGFFRYFTDEKGEQKLVSSLSKSKRAIYKGAGLSRIILNKFYKNTARRLRSTERDPISYLLSLIGGAIWDLTFGLALNAVHVVTSQALNLIPGVRVLRGQITEFLTSNRYLSAAGSSLHTFQSFIRGTFSPTTFSHTFIGYRVGNWLAPNAAVSQIMNPFTKEIITLPFTINPVATIFGAVGFSWGSFYTTALKMAANPYFFDRFGKGFVQQYKHAYALGDQAAINEGYLKGFRPSTLSKFADFLHRNWAIRIPINGWVVGDFLDKFMQAQFNWAPGSAKWIFAGADYLWQIKGPLLQKIGAFISELPVIQRLVTTFQFGISFPLKNWWSNLVYKATSFQQSLAGAIPVKWEMRTWAKIGTNFFNPGFFMGFGMVPWLSGFMPAPLAYFAAPVIGSLSWSGLTLIAEKITGAAIPQINAWAWSGYMIGSLLEFMFPNFFPPGFGNIMAFASPVIGLTLRAFGFSFTGLLSSGLTAIGNFIPAISGLTGAIAGSIASWATAMAIGSVLVLTVFFGYTIYAGFWVPMMEEAKAGPESSNFSINTDIQETAPNEYRLCSNFTITENVFNSQKYLIHKFDFQDNYLTVDLSDPEQTTDAFRNEELDYILFEPDGLTPRDYTIPPPDSDPPVIGYAQTPSILETYLSTPTDEAKNLKQLMAENQSVVYSMSPFFDILTDLAEEYKQTKHLVAEYQAQLKLMEAQQKLVEGISNRLRAGNLEEAAEFAKNYDNPLTDPCPDESAVCPEDKQGLKQLYDSWAGITGGYADRIAYFQGLADPPLTDYLAELETTIEGLKQQTDSLPEIISQMLEIQRRINSEEKADEILNASFANFANLSQEEQDAAWKLLSDYFPEVFKDSGSYYYIPQGTRYEVCVDADYCKGPDPTIQPDCPTGQPLTVCSTISYQPSFWGPYTGFAKHCATFTPQ